MFSQDAVITDFGPEDCFVRRIVEEDEEPQPKSYNQEVADAKKQLLNQAQDEDDEADEEDDFMIAKPKLEPSTKPRVKITEKDVEEADKDPDNFLSNFLAARAWVPTSDTKWKPLESDNESDEERADAYEDEYNMYFEDPNDQNSTLMTYARDALLQIVLSKMAPHRYELQNMNSTRRW